MRRTGKSTLLKQVCDELLRDGVPQANIFSINFESAAHSDIKNSKALYQHITAAVKTVRGTAYLFFDEIQMVDNWETCINSLRVDLDCDIYITGSNGKLLAGELATLLAGRYISIQVRPFSFREFLQVVPGKDQYEAFDIFRTLGGMPFLAQTDFEYASSIAYLSDVYNSIVLKDIFSRHGLRDFEQFERILRYLFSEIGTTLSIKNIVNELFTERMGISRETVYRYIKASEDALLLTRIKRKDIIGKEILRAAEKVYITDIGMREALLGTNQARVNLVFENIVASELQNRGYRIYIGKIGKKEIDFVAERGGETLYVQVTYLLATDDIVEREFSALLDVPDNFPKYVISADRVDFSQAGIRHMNIEDFLLMD